MPATPRASRRQPRASDLSFYNWSTGTHSSSASANWIVLADGEAGLAFKNKRDRKLVLVDPARSPGDSTSRTVVPTHEYAQAILIDHWLRRGAAS